MAPMPRPGHKHAVSAVLRVGELTNAGSSLDLEIFAEGSKLGDLVIGRGSLYWFGKGRQKRKTRTLVGVRTDDGRTRVWYKA
jgi:hypothetical protein